MPETLEGDGTDPDVGERTKLAAILGHPFSFAYQTRQTRYGLFGYDMVWAPGHRYARINGSNVSIYSRLNNGSVQDGKVKTRFPRTAPRYVKNRWVYVFGFSEKNQHRPNWLVELYIDKTGQVHVNPATDRFKKRKWAKPKAGTAPQSEERMNELARRINGRSQEYWFVGSRHRLSVKALDRFEETPNLYGRTETVNFCDGDDLLVMKDGSRAVPVDCPVDVAMRLHEDFTKTRLAHLQLLGSKPNDKKGPTEDQIEDLREYHVAKFVHNCLKNKDKFKHLDDIDDYFSDDGKKRVEKAVEAFEANARKHHLLAEITAADLSHWMDRFLFQIVIEEVEKGDEPIMLVDYHKCTRDISGSPAGTAYLRTTEKRLLAEGDSALYKHIIKPEQGIGTKFKKQKAVTSAVVGLVASFAKAGLADLTNYARGIVETASSRLKIAYELESAPLELVMKRVEHLAYRANHGKRSGSVKRAMVRVEAINTRSTAWRGLKIATALSEAALSGVLNGISLSIAARSYFTTPEGHKAQKNAHRRTALVAAAQTVTSLCNGLLAVLGESAATIPWRVAVRNFGLTLAIVAAGLDLATAVELNAKQDYDASIMLTLSVTASVSASLFSVAIAEIGLLSSASEVLFAGAIGFVLLLIAFFFYLGYLATLDNELETLVGHCSYGEDAGEGDAKPAWSPVPLKFLSSSWETQLDAIAGLGKGFTVELRNERPKRTIDSTEFIIPAPTARLNMGVVDEHTEFKVLWSWKVKRFDGGYLNIHENHEYEYWTALSQKDRTTRIFSRGGRAYIDLVPPNEAVENAFYFGGRFVDLMVEIRKIVGSDTGIKKLPHTNYMPVYCLLYTSPSPRDRTRSRMPSSA